MTNQRFLTTQLEILEIVHLQSNCIFHSRFTLLLRFDLYMHFKSCFMHFMRNLVSEFLQGGMGVLSEFSNKNLILIRGTVSNMIMGSDTKTHLSH
jgi:hypothetical protein